MQQIRVGTLRFSVDGVMHAIAGSFTLNLGIPKREAVTGMDGSHGHKVTPRPPFIEGDVRDRADLDVATLLALSDVTVQAELENGKAWVFRNCIQTGEGDMNPEEGTIAVRFDAESAQELT